MLEVPVQDLKGGAMSNVSYFVIYPSWGEADFDVRVESSPHKSDLAVQVEKLTPEEEQFLDIQSSNPRLKWILNAAARRGFTDGIDEYGSQRISEDDERFIQEFTELKTILSKLEQAGRRLAVERVTAMAEWLRVANTALKNTNVSIGFRVDQEQRNT